MYVKVCYLEFFEIEIEFFLPHLTSGGALISVRRVKMHEAPKATGKVMPHQMRILIMVPLLAFLDISASSFVC